MPTIDWNTTLSALAITENGYAESPPNNVISTRMDIGPSKLRRRSTATYRPLSITVEGSKADLALLDTFYVTTTFGGTLPFTITHPRTLATVTVRFRDGSPPKYSSKELVSIATIELEIQP